VQKPLANTFPEGRRMAETHDHNVRNLGKARLVVSSILTALMVGIYFGFILLVAYQKEWLGQQIVPGLSWGILLGAATIVSAWVLTMVYVLWANRVYDAGVDRIAKAGK
jgi:uncharacterized membrane protein (DUF485 family)